MVDVGFPREGVESRGWQLYIIGTVMVIVAGIFVALRLAARYQRDGIRVDDYTITAALICSIVSTIVHNIAVQNGFGKHEWDISEEHKQEALKLVLVAQILYKIVICLAKTSILCLYLRVFYVQKYFRFACFAMLSFTILSGVAYIPPTIMQCSPVAGFWDRTIPHKCISSRDAWLSYAVINIVTDFFILVLPIQEILRLNLKKQDKIALIFIFALGGFVCIISIVRAMILESASKVKDATWVPIPAASWSTVEINTGIVCACMPLIRQPLAMLFPGLFSPPSQLPSKTPTGSGRRRYIHHDTSLLHPTQPWTNTENNIILTSVEPSRRPAIPRTESQEDMIGTDQDSPRYQGIMKTTDVSISESRHV